MMNEFSDHLVQKFYSLSCLLSLSPFSFLTIGVAVAVSTVNQYRAKATLPIETSMQHI